MYPEVFGVAELRHTSCHLPAVSRAPQSFMSARLVMRADRKRWDSSISPPTHTEGDRLCGDEATGCTFLCRHACKLRVCVCMCGADDHTSPPQRRLLITLNFSWHLSSSSAEVTVSLSAISPSRALSSSFSLTFSLVLHPHTLLILPVRPFWFFLHSPLHLSKFDVEPSVNQTNVAPHSFSSFLHLTHFITLSRCLPPLCLLLGNISVLNDSYCTCVSACVCVCIGGFCISVFISLQGSSNTQDILGCMNRAY